MNLAVMTHGPGQQRRPPLWVRFAVPLGRKRQEVVGTGLIVLSQAFLCLFLAFAASDTTTLLGGIGLAVMAVSVCLSAGMLIWIWQAIHWMDRHHKWPQRR